MAACSSMASGVAANSSSILGASSVPVRAISRSTGFAKVSFSKRTVFSSLHTSRRASALKIVCAAKKETVDKVCSIVKSQLALTDDKPLTPESKFTELGADSLDTVEIVMALEEEFKITVEEENAGSITTVQEAADLIERLVQAGSQSAKA